MQLLTLELQTRLPFFLRWKQVVANPRIIFRLKAMGKQDWRMYVHKLVLKFDGTAIPDVIFSGMVASNGELRPGSVSLVQLGLECVEVGTPAFEVDLQLTELRLSDIYDLEPR